MLAKIAESNIFNFMKLLSEQVDEKEIAVILRELSKTKEISGDVVEFGCFVGTTSVFLAKEIEKWSISDNAFAELIFAVISIYTFKWV